MEENQIIEKKKSKAPIVILLVVLFIIAVAGSSFGGYLFGKADGDKIVKQTKTECDKKIEEVKQTTTVNDTEGEKTEVTNRETEKPKCYGTYLSSDNEKWILKEDGTYIIEGKEVSGAFVINDNTITFIKQKHTVGPKDQDPYFYDPKTYLITEDCSTVYFTSISSHIGAGLTKQN